MLNRNLLELFIFNLRYLLRGRCDARTRRGRVFVGPVSELCAQNYRTKSAFRAIVDSIIIWIVRIDRLTFYGGITEREQIIITQGKCEWNERILTCA